MSKLLVGDKMPNFTVNTAFKSGVTISDIVANKKTMFMVLRYIGCPVCRYDVHLLIQKYQEFIDKNVNVVVVMQSNPEILRRDLNGQTLPFDLICDDKLELYNALEINPAADMKGLVGDSRPLLKDKSIAATELGFLHGDYEGIEEQLPAFFIVDKDLTVIESHYAKDIMDMPTIDEMLLKA